MWRSMTLKEMAPHYWRKQFSNYDTAHMRPIIRLRLTVSLFPLAQDGPNRSKPEGYTASSALMISST